MRSSALLNRRAGQKAAVFSFLEYTLYVLGWLHFASNISNPEQLFGIDAHTMNTVQINEKSASTTLKQILTVCFFLIIFFSASDSLINRSMW